MATVITQKQATRLVIRILEHEIILHELDKEDNTYDDAIGGGIGEFIDIVKDKASDVFEKADWDEIGVAMLDTLEGWREQQETTP